MPASNHTTPPRPPSCRIVSRGKVFVISPLGLFVERKGDYEEAHLQQRISKHVAGLLRLDGFNYDICATVTVNRIAAYRAKRDALDGVL